MDPAARWQQLIVSRRDLGRSGTPGRSQQRAAAQRAGPSGREDLAQPRALASAPANVRISRSSSAPGSSSSDQATHRRFCDGSEPDAEAFQDRAGRFPEDSGVNPALIRHQPLLALRALS